MNNETPELDELIPTERIGLVVYGLARAERLSTADVARMAGITSSGAYRMMSKLCRVLPIRYVDGAWEMVLAAE